MSKRGLGKGLGALIPSSNNVQYDPENDKVVNLNIEEIKPNSFQPRKNFDPEKLAELAASIKEHGVIQPVIVRPDTEGYELVVGERRLRACKQMGINTIPAVIKTLTDEEMTEIALIENIQRHDLNPVEEARAYKRLMVEFGLTQDEVAKKVGKSRPFIANFLRLLQLPEEILDFLDKGILSVGHVRPLLTIDNKSLQIELANKIIENKLSVRNAEELAKKAQKNITKEKKEKKSTGSPVLNNIKDQLQIKFGTKVIIKDDGKKGKIEIEYYNQEDLQRILDIIGGDYY